MVAQLFAKVKVKRRKKLALQSELGQSERGKSKKKVHPGGHRVGYHEESHDSLSWLSNTILK